MDCNLNIRPAWFAESKAELKSKEAILVSNSLSKESCKLWVQWRKALQVPKPFLNPNWVGGKTFDLSIKPKMCLTSKHSKILDKMGIKDIDLYSEVWDGEEDFDKAVTFAVHQHTGKEPCWIKIWNTTANLGAKISTILIKTKGNKPLGSTLLYWSRSIKRFSNSEDRKAK